MSARNQTSVAGAVGRHRRQLDPVTLPVGNRVFRRAVHRVQIAHRHPAPERIQPDPRRRRYIGRDQVGRQNERVEPGFVDRIERHLVYMGPRQQVARRLIQICALPGQPPGHRQIERDRMIGLRRDADIPDAVAGQGAFGMHARDRRWRAFQCRICASDDRDAGRGIDTEGRLSLQDREGAILRARPCRRRGGRNQGNRGRCCQEMAPGRRQVIARHRIQSGQRERRWAGRSARGP